jgi:ankyrin repeat protein
MAPKLSRGDSGVLARREAVMTAKSHQGTMRGKPGKRKVKGADKVSHALLEAAVKGKKEAVSKLIAKGAGVDCKDKLEGDTPLVVAAEMGHGDFVREMIK